MEGARQFEICQEARFVLWALRCAIARGRGETGADAEISRGFELADVPETTPAFLAFGHLLASVEWHETVWHHPQCRCVSTEEMWVLRALAECTEPLHGATPAAIRWWRLLLPAAAIPAVVAAARSWLAVLERAGVVFPSPAELLECLVPLEGLAGPARVARLH